MLFSVGAIEFSNSAQGFNQVWPLINRLYLLDHRGLRASISPSVLKKQSGTLRLHPIKGWTPAGPYCCETLKS